MEKRPDEYRQFEQFDLANSQKPQKKQHREVIGFPVHSNQPQPYVPTKQPLSQARMTQKPKGPKPMPKARALAFVNTLKKSLVVASLAAFVSFGGLAAFHQVGTIASKTASVTSTSSKSNTSSQNSSKSVLKQTGGSNIGTSSSSTGTSTGTGSSSSSSTGTSSSTGSSSSTSSSAVSGSNVS